MTEQYGPELLLWRPPPKAHGPKFLAAACAVFLPIALLFFYDVPGFGALDLCQYWSAAVLALRGDNPYDPALLSELELAVNPPSADIRMWNPPFIIPLIGWMAAAPFRWIVPVWFLFSISLLVFAGMLATSGRFRMDRWSWLFAASFPPAMTALYFGQGTFLLLFGFLGYLACVGRSGDGRLTGSFAGGLFLSATLVKPHALYLLYPLIAAASIRERRYRAAAGFLAGALLLTAGALAIQPRLFEWYVAAMERPPVFFRTPTLGSWLQDLTGRIELRVRLIPSILTGVLFLAWLLRRRTYGCADLFWVLPLALTSSPYAWTYDHMVLLPFALRVIILDGALGGARFATAAALGSSALLLSLPFGPGLQWDVWYPAALWSSYCLLRRKTLSLRGGR